jgi:uncharacterized protein YxeA
VKKLFIILVLLIVVSTSLTAIAWNPWLRHWTFTLESGENFTLLFKEDSWAYDEEGNQFGYTWKYDMILTIYRFRGAKWQVQVESFEDDNEEAFTGYVIGTEEKIEGHTQSN